MEKILAEIRKVLQTANEIEIVKISDLGEKIDLLYRRHYNLTELGSKTIIENHLIKFIKTLRDDLYVVIEAPYVDKTYRDTYYKFYSSKRTQYHRDSIRLSFFSEKIEITDFRLFRKEDNGEAIIEKIVNHYLGFLILRPTFPKIIGRNAISPHAKKINNFVCCLAKINATVGSVKQKISAFPHSSQDNQTMTCAETTIWSIMEYFGNKYPEYKPVLLSQISDIIHRFSYKRLLPSDGLTAEQITYIIRELGFGAMIYSKEKQKESLFPLDFVISSYVESGIPVIGVLKNDTIGHVISIIGREKFDNNSIAETEPNTLLENGLKCIDFNKIPQKYVLIDDNYPPYQLANLNYPFKEYYENEDWHNCDITHIVVPLYNKIYLDATRASKNFYKEMENKKIGINDGETRVIKIFLASSRSYKQYIALNKNLQLLLKEFILGLLMPKFIWIAEVSKTDAFKNGMCNELFIQDATEPIEYSEKSIPGNVSLLVAYTNGKLFINRFGEYQEYTTFAGPFDTFKENLK